VRIKLLVGLAGPTSLSEGDEIDRPEDEALRMIAARFAIPVPEPVLTAEKPIERAVAKKVREKR
jgi:hypothetical protein